MSLVHLLGRPARSCAKLLPKASGITCISNTSSASAVQLASARFASVLAAPKRAAHTRSWSSYLLFLPSGVAAFLTYWQYQRMQWKQRLIDDATAALQQPPVNAFTADELPHQRRAVAEGFYQHARSVCVGPRTRSAGPVTVKGCTLITPLHNPETKRTILVNRGFVPNEWAQDAAMRAKGQPSARVCEVCVAQESENPSAVVPANRPATKEFFWIDVPAIAEACGLPPATPLIQVMSDNPPAGGPHEWTYPVPKSIYDLRHFKIMPEDHRTYAMIWGSLSVSIGYLARRAIKYGK